MDWTLIAGIGLTIWATLVVLSNERSAIETAKKSMTPATIPPADNATAAKH
jgi:hypothetical protein